MTRLSWNTVLKSLSGSVLLVVFTGSWLLMWGLLPGTPAADEVRVAGAARWNLAGQILHGRKIPERQSWMYGAGQITANGAQETTWLSADPSVPLDYLSLCPHLTRLDIQRPAAFGDSAPFRVLETLPLMPLLQELVAYELVLGDLSFLQQVPNLERLICIEGKALRSLEGLRSTPFLTRLHLPWHSPFFTNVPTEQTQVLHSPSLAPIGDLQYLTELNLAGRQLTDLSPLWRCQRLRQLTLTNCGVTTLTGIEALAELRSLDLDSNQVADLRPLLALPHVRTLRLKGNPETPENVEVVKTLRERGVRIPDLEPGRQQRGRS